MSLLSSSWLAPESLVGNIDAQGSGRSVTALDVVLLAISGGALGHPAHLRHLGWEVLVHSEQFLAGLLGEVQAVDLGRLAHQLAPCDFAQG